VLARELAREPLPAVELVQQLGQRLVRAQILASAVADGRRLEAVRRAQHRGGELSDGRRRRLGGAELLQRRQRRLAQPLGLLLDPLGGVDGAAAEPSLDEVDARARQARVRAAQGSDQLAPAAAGPREAEEREERVAERRLCKPAPLFELVRDAERAEHGLERRAPALERRADDADAFGRRARANEREQLLADHLERAARAGTLEKANGAVER